jgi:21S rRNA (GM2251-2'-O)-methyltransferase
MDYLYGVNPVLNALQAKRRTKFAELLVQDRSAAISTPSLDTENILKLASELLIPIVVLDKHDLNMLAENRPHQGVILACTPIELRHLDVLPPPQSVRPAAPAAAARAPAPLPDRPWASLKVVDLRSALASRGLDTVGVKALLVARLEEAPPMAPTAPTPAAAAAPVGVIGDVLPGPLWLALDEVVDPQNFGAIVRTATFLGAAGVVVCAKNSAALSPVVSKASAGALEIASLFSTRNMPRFLAESALSGWRVVGTTLDRDSIPLRTLPVGPPTLLVLGNEGHGLRPLVQRACDVLVKIDAAPSSSLLEGGAVDSLNVAVSGGIVMHHLLS